MVRLRCHVMYVGDAESLEQVATLSQNDNLAERQDTEHEPTSS